MKCPFADFRENHLGWLCFCTAKSNPGNERAEKTTAGVDRKICVDSENEEYKECPIYKKDTEN